MIQNTLIEVPVRRVVGYALTFIALILFFSSCVTHKQLKYLELDESNIDADSLYEIAYEEYYLQKGDLIDIKVKSIDPQSIAVFNNIGDNVRTNVTTSSVYLSSYLIDDNGLIQLPIIGQVKAQGLTVQAFNDTLVKRTKQYFNVVSVYSKITNFRVTVMGEVNSPGSTTLFYEDNNILSAIASVGGGFTDYSDKRNIRLIRKLQNEQKVINLDLTKADIIKSPYYFLHPNDVIYVEPIKAKPFKLNTSTFGLLISSISLLILIINSATRN